MAVAGSAGAPEGDITVAEDAGRALAEHGVVVVTGGRGGVMEAACRGAVGAGGITLGILPGLDRGDANPFVSIALPTGLGEARNALVVRAADALIAVGGEWGTLSEIALALAAGKPVVGVGTWELGRRGDRNDTIVRAADGAEAARLALEALG